jgi:5-methylcytosine-specific restriction endonuclease McrA
MADSEALRSRRARLHAKGDHRLCKEPDCGSYGRVAASLFRPCKRCGAAMLAVGTFLARGRPPAFCSDECRVPATVPRPKPPRDRSGYVAPRRLGACSECGGPMNVGRDSASPEFRRCQKCRRANPKQPKPGPPRPCMVCGNVFQPTAAVIKTCSRRCGGMVAHWSTIHPGEPFDREAMEIISAGRRQRRTVRCRERRLRHAETWDGITDEEILKRDGWRCQVPECLYGSRKINPRYKYPHPRSKAVDHIVPLSLGGDDTAVNKRAAHHGCNMARGNRMGHEQLPLFGSTREAPRETFVAGTPRAPLEKRACNDCGREVQGKRWLCTECASLMRAARERERLEEVAKREELGRQAARMRAARTSWEDITAVLGISNPGTTYQLARRYGDPAVKEKWPARYEYQKSRRGRAA